tara:strand:+ start:610 stop:1185 length:576 start_codon:yes stop_codon:yes gene_type:complete
MPKKKSKSNKKKSFIETGLNFCNSIALITNLFFFIISLVYILWFINFDRKYTETNGKILSVTDRSEVEKCTEKKKMTRLERKTTVREKSYCNIEVEYIVDDNKYTTKIETTEYSNKYKQGGMTKILYNKNDFNDVILKKKHMMFKILYYISIVLLITISVMSYLRVYHRDNTLVKWWIGIECLDNFIPDFD